MGDTGGQPAQRGEFAEAGALLRIGFFLRVGDTSAPRLRDQVSARENLCPSTRVAIGKARHASIKIPDLGHLAAFATCQARPNGTTLTGAARWRRRVTNLQATSGLSMVGWCQGA